MFALARNHQLQVETMPTWMQQFRIFLIMFWWVGNNHGLATGFDNISQEICSENVSILLTHTFDPMSLCTAVVHIQFERIECISAVLVESAFGVLVQVNYW